jgi:hypothetical protein
MQLVNTENPIAYVMTDYKVRILALALYCSSPGLWIYKVQWIQSSNPELVS